MAKSGGDPDEVARSSIAATNAAVLLRGMRDAGLSRIRVEFSTFDRGEMEAQIGPGSDPIPVGAMLEGLLAFDHRKQTRERPPAALELAVRQVALDMLDAEHPGWRYRDFGCEGTVEFTPDGVVVEFGEAVREVRWTMSEFMPTAATLDGHRHEFDHRIRSGGRSQDGGRLDSGASGRDIGADVVEGERRDTYMAWHGLDGVPATLRAEVGAGNLELLRSHMVDAELDAVTILFDGSYGGCAVGAFEYEPRRPNTDMRLRGFDSFEYGRDREWFRTAAPDLRFPDILQKTAIEILDMSFEGWAEGVGTRGSIRIDRDTGAEIEIAWLRISQDFASVCSIDAAGHMQFASTPSEFLGSVRGDERFGSLVDSARMREAEDGPQS